MVVLLYPPVYSLDLKRKLTTVSEAIDYIDTQLPKDVRNDPLVQAARAMLHRSEDGNARSVSSHMLAKALLFVEINQRDCSVRASTHTNARISKP